MKRLLPIFTAALFFGTSVIADTKLGENYNMGCGEVSTLKSYDGVPSVYWVELSIENGKTSGVASDARLIKRIQKAKLDKNLICLGLEYDSETETNFISYLKNI